LDLIAVIIVNWNGKKFIEECLNGLIKQTCSDFLIILVDNGSNDGSLELVQENYPEVQIIGLTKNLGFAAANNIAIISTDTEYVAVEENSESSFRIASLNTTLGDGLNVKPDAITQTLSHDLLGA